MPSDASLPKMKIILLPLKMESAPDENYPGHASGTWFSLADVYSKKIFYNRSTFSAAF